MILCRYLVSTSKLNVHFAKLKIDRVGFYIRKQLDNTKNISKHKIKEALDQKFLFFFIKYVSLLLITGLF